MRCFEGQQYTDYRWHFHIKREESLAEVCLSFSWYFAHWLLTGRSCLQNSGLHLMRLTGVSSCSAHSVENMSRCVLQQQQHSCTNMHTRSVRLDNSVGELTGLYKDTLFNLLPTLKATAPQSRHVLTAVDMTVSLLLKSGSTALSAAVQQGGKRSKIWRRLIVSESISHQGYDNPKSPQNPTQPFKWAQRPFLHH